MIWLLLGLVFAPAPAETFERASRPVLEGRGDGSLVLLEVPEKVPLDFWIVQCIRAGAGEARFSVSRSGKQADPPEARSGAVYVEKKLGLSFRIETGKEPFAVGDAFAFATYPDPAALDRLFDRWLNEYVKWIISREERERFLSLTAPIDQLGFMESFWKRRDPDPRTPENEAREEHARRFAYAVRTFGAGKPGWATDRGKIYIVLGPPHAIQRNPAGRTAFERPSEVWTYNHLPSPRLPASLDVGFVDFTGTGDYEIVSASHLDVIAPLRTNFGYAMSELEAIGLLRSGGDLMDPLTGLRTAVDPTRMATEQFDFQRNLREIAAVPSRNLPPVRALTEAEAAFPSIPLSVEAASFPAHEGHGLAPITVAVPYARLTPERVEDGYRYSADVLIRVLSGAAEVEVADQDDRIEVRAAPAEIDAYRESELLYETSLLLPAGSYRVEVLLRDNPSGAIGKTTAPLQIEAPDGQLSLSSLLLARGAVELPFEPTEEARAPFRFGNLRVVPNVGKRFPSGATLTAYFQVFGYRQEKESEAARLRVEFFLLREGRLYSKVAPSYHRPSGRDRIAVRSEISLSGFPVGSYALRARVTDELSGEQAEREADFTVIAPR